MQNNIDNEGNKGKTVQRKKRENKTIELHHSDKFILNALHTEKEQNKFQKQIDRLFNKYDDKMSLPLITNLAL